MWKAVHLRVCRIALLAVACCLALPFTVSAEMRVWKSKSGTYEVRAELISADAESVKLATEDGREITVPLAKLSQADRDYLAAQSSAATTTGDSAEGGADADDAEKKIKLVFAQFYRSVGRQGASLRQFLTEAGQASFDRSPSFYEDVRGPDRGKKPRVTQVAVHEDDGTATADYRLRLDGKTYEMQMLFTLQEDRWRVSGIVGPGPGGTKNKMDFDSAQSVTGATNLASAKKITDSAAPTSADALASGADAYAAGLCAKCHGDDGAGSDLGPDLTDGSWDHCDGSVAGIRAVLVSGVPKEQLVDPTHPHAMNPATNRVAESDLDALAAFVKSLGSAAE